MHLKLAENDENSYDIENIDALKDHTNLMIKMM